MNGAKMWVFGLLVVMLGLLASPAYAEFTTIAGWDRQLFPSYAVATATLRSDDDAEADENELGDPRGLLGIVIDAPSDDATVKVTIECGDIMEPSTFTGTLAKEGETYTIRPRIKYKYGALTQTKQATPLEAMQLINKLYLAEVMQSQDASEGLHAFLEKRKPAWKNR